MPNLVSSRRMSSASVDFLSAWVDSTADGGTGVTLSSQAVAIALIPIGEGDPNETTTWRGASWTGSAGVARAAAILIGPGTSHVIPEGRYDVWVRVTDTPTAPIITAGRLTVY